MTPGHLVALAFGGLFAGNSVPHWVAGSMGRPFQSPFADPPGQGYSSARLNVLWGGLNAAIGWALLFVAGDFDPRRPLDFACAFGPALLGTYLVAGRFGRVNGGNDPVAAQARRDER